MAPTTEAEIHSSFLLPSSPLPAIISLPAFTALFPKSEQPSPQIKTLYRDLQHQRSRLTDHVARNIAAESKRGNGQRREVVIARREADQEGHDDEVEIETALFGPSSNLPALKAHTLKSILPELETAVEDLEDEVRRLDEEADSLLESMQSTVGGLSDLRYGRLANPQLRTQVLEGLSRLERSYDKK